MDGIARNNSSSYWLDDVGGLIISASDHLAGQLSAAVGGPYYNFLAQSVRVELAGTAQFFALECVLEYMRSGLWLLLLL